MKNIFKRNQGITLISLVITIIILLILSGITIGAISRDNSLINKAEEDSKNAQRETIIEKIEADLYNQKIKMGTTPNKDILKEIAKNYGTISEDKLITKDGNYEINFDEIIGWEE